MFKDVTLGQYIKGDSLIHKLDARLKIILTFVFVVVLFMISKPVSYSIFIAFTLLMLFLTKIPLNYVYRSLKPMFFIIIFTVILNLFLTPGEPIINKELLFGLTFKISKQGVNMCVLMFLRLVLLVIITSVLTLTTKPLMLTDGIEYVLKPLKIFKFPVHEVAMMMSIAIRFIPTLARETDKIIKAQKARGANFESGNIFSRGKEMIPLLVPLFVSAFRRADDLAVAMDSRCYNCGVKRTKMKQLKMQSYDYFSMLVSIIIVAFVFITQFTM